MASDTYNLDRFLKAQERVYPSVVRELADGRKRSHWMWYIFPQISGLGHSSTARLYSLESLAEARCYAIHPLLSARLLACTNLVNAVRGRPIRQILGSPDDLKFRSSMTLFALASEENHSFLEALRIYYKGIPDHLTLGILGMAGQASVFNSV